ncbi:winged helix-turn-helix domain-containing protein [Halorussus limi]|uniref:Winged helix-turn-helix domain-containing protein n=1 Tax=Halorussus limi TaxID=2938695 RepID=A0A8U0HYQ3_9EURY|nr:winged helix-turn-helix transcriptional regulator [Halorussus limi]UPV75644.1 winged helix-turn-helix domain-containing protein [Halorussus limi]
MKLAEPTDFEILEALEEHGRNTAQNISLLLDKDRSYVNTRLPHLAELELVKRVGPAENSGLYEITDRGRAVLDHRDSYGDSDVDFDAVVERSIRTE